MEANEQNILEYLAKVDKLIVEVKTNEELLMLSAAFLQRVIDIYDNMIGVEQRNGILQQVIDGKFTPKETDQTVQ